MAVVEGRVRRGFIVLGAGLFSAFGGSIWLMVSEYAAAMLMSFAVGAVIATWAAVAAYNRNRCLVPGGFLMLHGFGHVLFCSTTLWAPAPGDPGPYPEFLGLGAAESAATAVINLLFLTVWSAASEPADLAAPARRRRARHAG